MSVYKLSSRKPSAHPAEIYHFLSKYPPLDQIAIFNNSDGTHYHWPIDGGSVCILHSGDTFKPQIDVGNLPEKQILMELVSVAMRSGDPLLIADFAQMIKEVCNA